jgi:hypothetical protein
MYISAMLYISAMPMSGIDGQFLRREGLDSYQITTSLGLGLGLRGR